MIWNNTLGELWRRTTVYLPRHLAAVLGITQKRLRQLARIAYVKVAEYQARGLVHLHVVIRVDRAMPDYRRDEIRPPDPRFTSGLLEHAVNGAIEAVSAPIAEDLAGELGEQRVRWGQERDVRPVEERGRARRLPRQVLDQINRAGRRPPSPDRRRLRRDRPGVRARPRLPPRRVQAPRRSRSSAERRAPRRGARASTAASTPAGTRPTAITTRRDGAASLAWRARQAQGRDEHGPHPAARRNRAHRPDRADRDHRAATRSRGRDAAADDGRRAGRPPGRDRRDRHSPAARTQGRRRSRRSAAGGQRAQARLPRPLPDQEPALVNHLHGAAPRARATRPRAAARRPRCAGIATAG